MFAANIIGLISKFSPLLGGMMKGVNGRLVGNLVSTALGGVDMHDSGMVAKSLEAPDAVTKLRELELQLSDLQNARIVAGKESGSIKWVRPFLALLAMGALVADICAINYVSDKMLSEILVTMLVFLVWDIRQIYKFYFGSSDDLPGIGIKKK